MNLLRSPRAHLSSLPVFWKLLLPFLVLMIAVGAAGTFLVVRDLAEDARSALDQELSRAAVDARAAIHDKELYLLEAVNFASNIQGMTDALRGRDRAQAERLLGSVFALKSELDLLVATDLRGNVVSSLGSASRRSLTGADDLAVRASRAGEGVRIASVLPEGSSAHLAVGGAVCTNVEPCEGAGSAIAAVSLRKLASEVHTSLGSRTGTGVTFFGADTVALASAGVRVEQEDLVRARNEGKLRVPDDAGVIRVIPFTVGGRELGTFAITLPKSPAFAAVRRAGIKLAALVLIAMLGVVAVGALLSRFILRQVRALVETSRAFGLGELDARVRAMSDDELGEVARALNQMAEQLQASYGTLESRVAQRTEEVRRLLEERTQFFAAMSHEFRTPLAVILSESRLILDSDRPASSRRTRDTIQTIHTSGEQLLRVINDILDLAQADAGKIEVDLEPVRLAELMQDLRSTIEGLARSGGSAVSIDMPEDLSPVMADGARLREVVLNLVDNAVKYTPEGGSIAISAERRNGSVAISVSDTGVGIPSEIGERIFEPFFRVKGIRPARGQASSGLGLALAKRFVEAQGGNISFESVQGAGTTFTVTLKAVPHRKRARTSARGTRTRS